MTDPLTDRQAIALLSERRRQHDVLAFVARIAARHPELRRVVRWLDFITMAKRDGVFFRLVPLSRPARLLRYGRHVEVQINDALDRKARTMFGMHELCHFWRDDLGVSCYHADDEWLESDMEDFANLFAWAVTSPARIYVVGLRPEDFD